MSLPGNWRLQVKRYRLVGKTCQKCGARSFPARDICPLCGTLIQMSLVLSGWREACVSRTAYPPRRHDEGATHTAALVQLAAGPRIAGN